MKKNILFSIVLLPIITFFISSCDKVNPPYMETANGGNDTALVRKFILEEFTGHQCPNCPQGNIKAQQLKSIYGEKLILISVHAGDFAEPGIGEFSYDFRCSTGNELNTFFAPPSFPSGMVSRTSWPSNVVIDKDAWGTRIETINNLAPDVKIEINNSYTSSTRTSDVSLEFDVLRNIVGTYKVAVYLTEDSIVKPQQNSSEVIPDYIHRDVIRGVYNSTFGDTLMIGNINKNDQFQKDYSMVLNSNWNENFCYIVVIVYNTSNYEIIQVEEKRIK